MANVRVNPNLEAEVTGHVLATRGETHGQMERALGSIATAIAWRARMIARAEFYRTGAYTRSIQAEHGVDENGGLVGRVVADDWKAHWAEFGWGTRTGGTRARHVLARAAQQVGFAVVAGPALGGGARALGGAVGRRALGGSTGRTAIGGQRLAITGR
jgi:hypothetical protein